MSNINLNIVGENTFGSRLPTVFIQSLILSDNITDGSDGRDSFNLEAKLTIKFTKPAHLEFTTTEAFLEEHLNKLQLYAYITTDNTSFADALNNERLDLLEWHNYLDTLNDRLRFSTVEVTSKLRNLVTTLDATLDLNNSFDGNGNEIIEISNITCEFEYIGRDGGTVGTGEMLTAADTVSDIYFFTMVGQISNDLEEDELVATESSEPATGVLYGTAKNRSSQTYNSFFGNITYYHLLESGTQTSRFYRQYSLPDGSPYLNPVLQSINGKFYATDDYGYLDIKSRIEALANNFSVERSSDSILNKNISDLEAIILAENNRTNLLGEMAAYRSTYPNKDQATASGRFYNSFIIAYSEILVSVQAQPELAQTLYLDTLLVDTRLNQMGGSYEYQTLPEFEKGTITAPSDDFIPSKWFQIARSAYNIIDLEDTNYSGEEYIAGSMDEKKIESATGSVTGEYQKELRQRIQDYKDEGLSDEIAEELASEEVAYARRQSGAADALALFGLSDEYGLSTEKNFAVHNKGIFFFDYEKALRTQSATAELINLTKMQQYFRRAVSYQYFYVEKVELSREEVYIATAATAASDHDSIKCVIYADFKAPPGSVLAGQYQNLDKSHTDFPTAPCQFSTGLEWYPDEGGTADAIADLDLYKFNYLRPIAETSAGTTLTTYLKLKNFDVMNSDRTARLDGFNDLSVLSSFEGAGSVYDGYRLMCFEYSDIMDDDVAFYNASARGTVIIGDTRKTKLASMNAIDAERTVYKITVTVRENCKGFLDDFYVYLKEIYDEYMEYSSYAEEVCSFNNITNSYNQFFIEGITAKYAAEAPWAKAAYAFTALADILFNPSQITAESLNYMVMDRLAKISPSTGTLLGTLESGNAFKALLDMIGPVGTTATYDPSPVHKANTSYGGGGEATFEFSNQIDFGAADTGMITGNFYPDFEGSSLVSRETAPFIIIPKYAFMGGRTGLITSDGDDSTPGEMSSDTVLSSMTQVYAGVVGETAIKTFARESVIGELTTVPGAHPTSEEDPDLSAFVGESGYIDRGSSFGVGAGGEIDILDPFATSTLRIAYDEIFLPYDAYDWRDTSWLNIWDMERFDDGSFGGIGLLQAATAGDYRLDNKPAHDALIGDYYYSVAAKLAHEIFMRSSPDVIMNAAGTKAKRKGTGISPYTRRDHRQLSDLVYLISNYYIPEATRRQNDPEAAKNRYSTIVQARQNAHGWPYGSMGTDIHYEIKRQLEFMLEACQSEMDEPTMTAGSAYDGWAWPVGRARGDRTYGNSSNTDDSGAAKPLRGMSDVVSYYDYPGYEVKLYTEYED